MKKYDPDNNKFGFILADIDVTRKPSRSAPGYKSCPRLVNKHGHAQFKGQQVKVCKNYK